MSERIERRRYGAARGGHAPGHLRDAFIQCIEDPSAEPWYSALKSEDDVLNFRNAAMNVRWNGMTAEERGRWLTGQLWNCTDVMPGSMCDDLNLLRGSTYAVAARKLRQNASQ